MDVPVGLRHEVGGGALDGRFCGNTVHERVLMLKVKYVLVAYAMKPKVELARGLPEA